MMQCGFCAEPVPSGLCQYVDSKLVRHVLCWVTEVNQHLSPPSVDQMSPHWCQVCHGLTTGVLRNLTHLGERLSNRRDGIVRVKMERSSEAGYSCGTGGSGLQDSSKHLHSQALAHIPSHLGLGSPNSAMNGDMSSLPNLIDQIKSLNQQGGPSSVPYHPIMASPPKLLSPSSQHTNFGLTHPALGANHQVAAAAGTHQGSSSLPFPYMYFNSQSQGANTRQQSAFTPPHGSPRTPHAHNSPPTSNSEQSTIHQSPGKSPYCDTADTSAHSSNKPAANLAAKVKKEVADPGNAGSNSGVLSNCNTEEDGIHGNKNKIHGNQPNDKPSTGNQQNGASNHGNMLGDQNNSDISGSQSTVGSSIGMDSLMSDSGNSQKIEEGISGENRSLLDSDLHKCFVCHKVFTDSKWLKAHMTKHRVGNDFVCSECNKTFSDRRNFRRHCRLHSEDTPYKCEVCGKKCGRNKDLKNHMKSHESERPFVCSLCGRGFKHQHGYNHHMATHESGPFGLPHQDITNLQLAQLASATIETISGGITSSRISIPGGGASLLGSGASLLGGGASVLGGKVNLSGGRVPTDRHVQADQDQLDDSMQTDMNSSVSSAASGSPGNKTTSVSSTSHSDMANNRPSMMQHVSESQALNILAPNLNRPNMMPQINESQTRNILAPNLNDSPAQTKQLENIPLANLAAAVNQGTNLSHLHSIVSDGHGTPVPNLSSIINSDTQISHMTSMDMQTEMSMGDSRMMLNNQDLHSPMSMS